MVLSFGAALGISALLFEYVFDFAGADAGFPLFAFVFLVALGIDYNIFLMTRVREETAQQRHPQGLAGRAHLDRWRDHLGGPRARGDLPRRWPRCRWCSWPSSASPWRSGVLLDTMIVRSVLVTAINLDLGGKIWWPSTLDRNGHTVAPPATSAARSRRRSDQASETRHTFHEVGRGASPGPPLVSLNAMARRSATPQQVRRALARAERGAALDVGEATALLAAPGDDLDRLCAAAARVRDAGLVAAGRPGCGDLLAQGVHPGHQAVPGPVPLLHVRGVAGPGRAGRAASMFLSPDEILDIARQGAELGCLEALFTLGDRPEDRWPEARQWLDEQGYDSTLAYVRAMAIRVLEETGLLPHLNPGVMSWEEINRLKPVSPSMGMMLETTSRRLFETKGEAHFGSPDKDPEVRLRVLEDAGRLSIPFTTGLLVGIGETLTERAETIFALRATSRRYGAVQEVIVQNFRAKPDTAMRHADDLRPRRVPRRDRGHPPRPRPEGAGAGAAQPGRPRRVPRPARAPASTTGAGSRR